MMEFSNSQDAYIGIEAAQDVSPGVNHIQGDEPSAVLPRGHSDISYMGSDSDESTSPMHPRSWYKPPSANLLTDPAFSSDPRLNPYDTSGPEHLLRPGGQRRTRLPSYLQPQQSTQRAEHPQSRPPKHSPKRPIESDTVYIIKAPGRESPQPRHDLRQYGGVYDAPTPITASPVSTSLLSEGSSGSQSSDSSPPFHVYAIHPPSLTYDSSAISSSREGSRQHKERHHDGEDTSRHSRHRDRRSSGKSRRNDAKDKDSRDDTDTRKRQNGDYTNSPDRHSPSPSSYAHADTRIVQYPPASENRHPSSVLNTSAGDQVNRAQRDISEQHHATLSSVVDQIPPHNTPVYEDRRDVQRGDYYERHQRKYENRDIHSYHDDAPIQHYRGPATAAPQYDPQSNEYEQRAPRHSQRDDFFPRDPGRAHRTPDDDAYHGRRPVDSGHVSATQHLQYEPPVHSEHFSHHLGREDTPQRDQDEHGRNYDGSYAPKQNNRPAMEHKQELAPELHQSHCPPLAHRLATVAHDLPTHPYGRRNLNLDRIDELDESDPFNLTWHNAGRYEAITSSAPSVSQPYDHRRNEVVNETLVGVQPGQLMPPSAYSQHPQHRPPPQLRSAESLSQPSQFSYPQDNGDGAHHRQRVAQREPLGLRDGNYEVSEHRQAPAYTSVLDTASDSRFPRSPPSEQGRSLPYSSDSSSYSSSAYSDSYRGSHPPRQHVPKQLTMPPLLHQQRDQLGLPVASFEPREHKTVAQHIPIANQGRNVLRKKVRKSDLPQAPFDSIGEPVQYVAGDGASKNVRNRLSKGRAHA